MTMAGLIFRSLLLGGSRSFSTCVQVPLVRKTLHGGLELPQTRLCWSRSRILELRGIRRWYSSSSGEENGGEEGGGGKHDGKEEGEEGDKEEPQEEGEEGEELSLGIFPIPHHHAIAPVNIPEVFPEVPVLPISRNPLFPRFVKMLEVRLVDMLGMALIFSSQIYDKELIKLIRQKVKLMQPYAGAFLKKDDK